ncbi:MAG: putative amidohydrolase [Alteromonadaceae bacterium]
MPADKLNLLAFQLTSSPDIDDNFAQLDAHLHQLMGPQNSDDETFEPNWPSLVVLPEGFALFGGHSGLNLKNQEVLGDGPIQARLSAMAKKYRVWLAGGTIATVSHRSDQFFSTLTVFDSQGQLIADYQKIHLFDADVADGTGAYRESDTTVPGNRVVVFDLQGITVGLAVCYDVRFPGLFSALRASGAQICLLPSAFTQRTGRPHWETLIKARAIENQLYMVAPAQDGIHANGRETYGHSLIVDPWGDVLADAGTGTTLIRIVYEQKILNQVRQDMPVKQHDRFIAELNSRFIDPKQRANE